MLNTSMLEEIYETTLDAWMFTHGGTHLVDPLVCDMCGEEVEGILYNVPGDGMEWLICKRCYAKTLTTRIEL